jgi:hypothetical protein
METAPARRIFSASSSSEWAARLVASNSCRAAAQDAEDHFLFGLTKKGCHREEPFFGNEAIAASQWTDKIVDRLRRGAPLQ